MIIAFNCSNCQPTYYQQYQVGLGQAGALHLINRFRKLTRTRVIPFPFIRVWYKLVNGITAITIWGNLAKFHRELAIIFRNFASMPIEWRQSGSWAFNMWLSRVEVAPWSHPNIHFLFLCLRRSAPSAHCRALSLPRSALTRQLCRGSEYLSLSLSEKSSPASRKRGALPGPT